MIPDFTGLILIERPVSVATRRSHPSPTRRTTRRPTPAGPARRSDCPAEGMEAARPSRHAAGGGPGSAEPHCPPPYSPRTRHEQDRQLVRQPATGGPPPHADQRAAQIGRRGGSRRTDGAGSTKAARYCHRRWGSARTAQAARRWRPLPRRAARMARPARVRIRRRKPCFLCRRRLFGWNVRLLTG